MPKFRTFASFVAVAAAAALASTAVPARAGDDHSMHMHMGGHEQHEQQEHHHHHAEVAPGYSRQVVAYQLPATTFVRADGARTQLPQAIDDGKPVVLNFIYTTCTAICPILSHTFGEFQRRLGAERDQIHMVSISIDPEEDTPKRLTEYAKRFDAGKQWAFYTGSTASSVTLQKAFKVYFGDKMHHRPVTFLRAAPGQPWVRLDGFTSPEELLAEYQQLVHPQH